MKPQLIFGVLTIATGLLGGSFTHPAIAFAERVLCTQRCCIRPWHLPRGEAQIAHRIPPQQTSPILIQYLSGFGGKGKGKRERKNL